MGLDRCAATSGCEPCLAQELSHPYCIPTRQRQRVICSRCLSRPSASIPSRICGLSLRPIWTSEGVSTLLPGNISGAGERLFFRSCGSQIAISATGGAPPRRGPKVFATAPIPDLPLQSSPGLRGARQTAANSSVPGLLASTSMAGFKDESPEVLAFAGLNAVVLLLSVRSLRKQQRAALERTMGNLYAPVGNGTGSDPAPRGFVNVEGADLGRQITSFASSMASKGKAIERAVTEELSKASKEASSLVLDLKRTAEATVAQGVQGVSGGSEHKMK